MRSPPRIAFACWRRPRPHSPDDSGFRQAIAAYSEALRLANADLPARSPALRALAVGGNNLAAALEEKKDRDNVESDGMIVAAKGGLQYWKLAGTWLEEERAELRLTYSLLQAGQPLEAIQSARRCLDLCTRNNAPPIEIFFGYAALAMAQRAGGDAEAFDASRRHALALFEQVPVEERSWCQSSIDELTR